MPQNTLILYTRNRCPLCDKAKSILMELQAQFAFRLQLVDIEESDELTEKYGLMIPVVELNGEEIQYGQIEKELIMEKLSRKQTS